MLKWVRSVVFRRRSAVLRPPTFNLKLVPFNAASSLVSRSTLNPLKPLVLSPVFYYSFWYHNFNTICTIMMNARLTYFLLPVLMLGAIVPTIRAQSTAEEIYFASDPGVSPDGKTVVFSYDSDLWKVPAEGGTAVRLTGMDGEETNAAVSPDGRWLAFSSNQYGNADVYLMPINGGEIQRLTYHQADDEVESWSWDSNEIYFRSGRYNRVSTFRVSRAGGTPARIFDHYHNNVHNFVAHPETGEVFFNESWESFIFPHRKKYRGPYNPDIKSYKPETGELKAYTDWEGKDMWTIIDRNGNIFFVSDEANGEYNLYTLDNGGKVQLTDFDTSVKNPAISADGSVIVFEKEYRLYTYRPSTGTVAQIPVSVYQNNTLAKDQNFNVDEEVTAFDVSPDNKKLAFVSRGELFVSNADGAFIQKLDTDPMGRILEVKWLKDSRTLLFNQTVNGYQNWFTMPADGSGPARQLTSDAQNNRMLALDADRTRGVYLSGRNELRLIDLNSLESKTIVEDEFWGFQNEQPRFSPDGKYVLFTARRDFEHDLFVYRISNGETINLTKTGVSESAPFWSPDGKYIYFASSRVQPSYPRGSGETDIFRMALRRFDRPYKSDRFDKLFEEEKEAGKDEDESDAKTADAEINTTINTNGLMERIDRVGPSFGSQFNPYVIRKDEKTFVFYLSNHSGGETSLWLTVLEPFKDPQTKKVKGVDSYIDNLVQVDDKLYGLSRGVVYKIDLSSAEASKIETKYAFSRNLRSEFSQMFDELWANIEENFYNETFHGIDWKAVRERYRTYLPYVNSRSDFRRMMNDMLGELNSSHMGFSTFGEEEQEYYSVQTAATGIVFEQDDPYRVRRIITDSPADVTGTDVRPGDVLVAVNGQPIDPANNRERYFAFPDLPEELKLTFKRGSDTHQVKVHPASYFALRTNRYDEWVDDNQRRVDEQTDKRVAYVHMKNMGGGELENFLIEMTSETYQRDALILDLRYNTGGNVHNDVLQFLSQQPYLQWKYRNGDYASQPNFTPAAKPIVLLINEQSLSDAEVTAAGFKKLELGTVIGTPTYRWIIFTSGKGLVDGSFYRLPSWGVYSLDGQNLERTGVEPDIYVDNTFTDRLNGKDPQLDRAIDEILKQLNSN
jgi:tricorn protease